MFKKMTGILLSACIVLGGFMSEGTVACAETINADEYCEEALVDRFFALDEKVEVIINGFFEDHTIGIVLEAGGTDPANPTSQTKYWVPEATWIAFMDAYETYMWGENGTAKGWDTNNCFDDSNWSDGMLTSIRRSEMLNVINHMEAAMQPIWDVMHQESKGSKSRKSAAEKAAEKEERLKAEEERKALEEASRESVRLEKEAAETGFANGGQMQDAKAKGKSADEYYNNAVVDTPGIENPVPVAQGGKLVVDGKTTNMTATIEKVSSVYVDSIRVARQGTLLNVVKVNYPAAEAVITFYMPGVQAGDAIMAAQYEGGLWTDVEVTEVRADHVTLRLKGNGVVAFLK